jgi:hypothetical protein
VIVMPPNGAVPSNAAPSNAVIEAAHSGHPVEYAYLRAVPRVELGESVNVGVLVYCQARAYLACSTWLDPRRVRALDPDADVDGLAAALAAIVEVCRGEASAGPAGRLSPGQRFRWLTAPRSTVLQPGPVHLGLCREPDETLRRLTAANQSA